jgi:hypothetical protein
MQLEPVMDDVPSFSETTRRWPRSTIKQERSVHPKHIPRSIPGYNRPQFRVASKRLTSIGINPESSVGSTMAVAPLVAFVKGFRIPACGDDAGGTRAGVRTGKMPWDEAARKLHRLTYRPGHEADQLSRARSGGVTHRRRCTIYPLPSLSRGALAPASYTTFRDAGSIRLGVGCARPA